MVASILTDMLIGGININRYADLCDWWGVRVLKYNVTMNCYNEMLQWIVTIKCFNELLQKLLQWNVTMKYYNKMLQRSFFVIKCYNKILQWSFFMIKCYNKGVYAQEATTRATSDEIVAHTASHARVKIWGVHTGSVRAYDK